MKEIMRIKSNEEPQAIQRLGDGTYYYNYDITYEGTVETEEGEKPQWSFVQAHLFGYPNYKDCVEGIIRAVISASEEFGLINEYNFAVAKGETTAPIIEEYFSYCQLVAEIKEKTHQIFDNLN